MCRFKSGIILKTRCVLSESDNDSHSDLLEQLNIKDTKENAMTKFVRAELIPPNNEWWTDTDTWKINIDQDILPDWFEEDKEKYILMFRDSVKEWCEEHVLVDKKIDELRTGYYLLKRCEVKKLLNDIKVLCDNSTVTEMYGNSTVTRMWGNSTVTRMCDNSTVTRMWGNSTVTEMYGNSTVKEMHDNSTVAEMCDNSTVTRMCGNSIARDSKNRKVLVAGNYEVIRK